jgi:quinol monooxygenase YgiN
MFFEKWKNMEMENRAAQHLKAFRQRAGSLLAKPTEVTLSGMISEAGKFGEIAGLL